MLDPVAFPNLAFLLAPPLLAQSGSKLVAKKPAPFGLTYSRFPDRSNRAAKDIEGV